MIEQHAGALEDALTHAREAEALLCAVLDDAHPDLAEVVRVRQAIDQATAAIDG